MEHWIRNCETLMDEDADGDPCPALTEWEEGGMLKRRLGNFIKKASPSQKLIDDIQTLATENVLRDTVARTLQTWVAPSVSVEAQKSLHEYQGLMEDKIGFLATIYMKLVCRNDWKPFHMSIYKAINNIFLAVISEEEKFPHHPDDFHRTIIHFQIKPFLARFSEGIFIKLVKPELGGMFTSRGGDSLVTKIPTDLLVPTMRRVGCSDLLDPEWNFFGSWNDICREIRDRLESPIAKTSADNLLEEKSMAWKLARNSIACRKMSGVMGFGSMFGSMGAAPQAYQYFPKCSVKYCKNIETAKKPHSIRCQTCWYFHFCSEACQRYAEMFSMHDCDSTPPEKVEYIRTETEAYLGLKKNSGAVKHDMCNFCSTRAENLPQKLLKCGKCKSVAYCNRHCQSWDWPEHKQICKKA